MSMYFDACPPMHCLSQVLCVGEDTLGRYLVIDRTIAHVRGGGQLGDRGRIGDAALFDVRRVDGEIRHYVDGPPACVGEVVAVDIDTEFRHVCSRWHTAGHLVAAAMEAEIPGFEACAGQHWPADAWVAGAWSSSLTEDVTQRLQRRVDVEIHADRVVTVAPGGVRTVTVAGHRAVPCGGTHVANLSAIGVLHIESVRLKKGLLKARYVCSEKGGN